jgi:hypothetical protein
MKRSISIYSIVLCLFVFSEAAQAYWHWHCNGSNLRRHSKDLDWRAGKNSFQSGTGWRDALLLANARWNQAPGDFTFGIRNWGETYVGFGNGQHEIFFTGDDDFLDGAPARCVYYYNCNQAKINEVNVVFDNAVLYSKSDYQYSKWPYGGDWRPWLGTAIHELAHAWGGAHQNGTYNSLGEDWDHVHANNGKVRHYAGEDASSGEVHIYGRTNTTYKNDVGVSHWKYGGSDGEYSEHIPCKIYHTNGNIVANNTLNGFARYQVKPGSQYDAQFTYENNGYYYQGNVNTEYVISTNDYITTHDRRIRTRTLSLGRNFVYTSKCRVTIPADLTVGQTYWLGAIVDYTNSISEFSGSNNATWHQIQIIAP